MSHQVCHCGWSKTTTYQGLRIHQGKKGCTPKGMSIPESEQFRFSSYIPQQMYQGPPIKIEEPSMNIFTHPFNFVSQQNTWGNTWEDSDLLTWTTPVRTENVPVYPKLTTLPATEDAVIETIKSLMGTHNLDRTHRALDFSSGAQMPLRPVSQIFSTQTNPAAALVTVEEANKSVFQTPPLHSTVHQTTGNARRALDFSTAAQQPSLWPVSQIFSTQTNPAAALVTVEEANKSVFQTPPLHSTVHQTTGNARRALDFSTAAQQVGQQVWHLPTTTAQETVKPKEREKETEREKEKEREAQKLQRARQDRVRAELQQTIQTREQKKSEVRSSVKACKVALDAEWLQINSVFSEVMKVVEGARQKALQPVEERRKRVTREAQDLVQKLQKEIDKLKMAIDELDKNPGLQVLPQMCDWKNITVDTSFSFGTLRTTTSIMMEEIQQELEKLSSVELKRIPTFAVDVKLDPTTAHPCLVLSPDGKLVQDGGKHQKVPDAPQRFDMFGSILGVNRLTSGKSYWEVEVSNKAGWDLGVASRDANRKGRLSLNPDNGYWVTVHYEDEKYAALTEPRVSLSLTEKPQKVGVFVDYEEGLVSFYDVEAKSHIYSFTECSFSGGISPYFSPHLKQNENSHPLIISAVVVNV